MNLRFSPSAIADLLEIQQYIQNDLKNAAAAKRFIAMVLHRCSSLKTSPQTGQPLTERIGSFTDLRFLTCGSLVAIYQVNRDAVWIVRMVSWKQDFFRFLFEDLLSGQQTI